MRILIRNIDFQTDRLDLDLESPLGSREVDQLGQYLTLCNQMGFSEISLATRSSLPADTRAELSALVGSSPLLRFEHSPAAENPEADSRIFHRGLESLSPASKAIRYSIRFHDHRQLLDQLARFALLIGKAHALDEEALTRLRLSLCELGVETLASTRGSNSELVIDVEVTLRGGGAGVRFRHNAAVPRSAGRAASLVGKAGKTADVSNSVFRGITSNHRSFRDGDWHCTTYELSGIPRGPISNRRQLEEVTSR